ncbi:MAG: hypothetical protein QF787_11325 [Nitrospinota bacterium]|nr:hypothetical protein [Nitrospinota bacterium]
MKSMDKGMKPMGGMAAVKNAPVVPAVTGYSEGKTILFIHTETSDKKIAKILTDMMGGSPVLVVPALAKVPAEALSRVYVFANGLKGGGPTGPLGFQADVFENPPGDPGYSPLRKITLVRWKTPSAARRLRSAGEVRKAVRNGEAAAEETAVVVNMPFLTWPGGKR